MDHNPKPGETYNTELLYQTDDYVDYGVSGEVNGKEIEGTLRLNLIDGQLDGWDWKGTELTEDEAQAILDLFADEF